MTPLVNIAMRTTPLWLIGLALVAIAWGACELTIRLGRRYHSRKEQADEHDGSLGFIVTPVFALLAFMIATTFSMGLTRYDGRRMALMNEVDAISTEYERASMLDEPNASRLRLLLRNFAHCRIMPERSDAAATAARAELCRRFGDEMWRETRIATLPVKTTALASYVITGMNDVLNAATRRDVAVRAFIPTRVLSMLVLCIIAGSVCLGLVIVDSKRRYGTGTLLLFALYAVSFTLILDIDGSTRGSIAVSQVPLQELAARLDSSAP